MLAKFLAILTLALSLAWTSTANAYERWVNIHNVDGDGDYIMEVYFSHRDSNTWGYDLIGEAIPPGYYQTVWPADNMDGYCRGDILVIFSNGHENIARNVNFCEATDWDFWSD